MPSAPHIPQYPPLRSQYASDPDMGELILLYLQELQERSTAIAQAFAESQTVELQRISHQVRGSAGGYGYPQITELAGRVEDVLRSGGQIEQVQDLTAELLGMCRAAIEGGAD